MKHLEFLLGVGSGLLVLFFETGSYWSATWLSKWAVILLAMSVIFSVWVARRTSFLHLPLLLYSFGELIVLAAWPQSPYQQTLDTVTLIALQKNAFYGVLELASCVGIMALVARGRDSFMKGAVASFGLIWLIGVGGTLLLPLVGDRSPPNNGLWFGNPSMGGGLLACLFPFSLDVSGLMRINSPRIIKRFLLPFFWGLTFLAVYRTKASVPWGVLGVVTAALIAHTLRHRWVALLKAAVAITALALGMIFIGQHFLGYEFWNQNGRFEIWTMAWQYYRAHGNAIYGFGYSTSQIFLPLEQISTEHMHGQTFLWLHNDWLQLAIEGGFVGMFCIFLSLGRLLKAAWATSAGLASLAGFVTLAAMNYPLRMPIHCYCLAVLCGLIERQEWVFRSFGTSDPMPSRSARKNHSLPVERTDPARLRSYSQSEGLNRSSKSSY